MGDFHQQGIITSLHQLHTRSLEDLEAELYELSREQPMALVLPCLYSELEGPALSGILDELNEVNYLDQIVREKESGVSLIDVESGKGVKIDD